MRARLGSYILLKTIGSGGTAKVKLAEHIESQKKFAIKILKKQENEDEL